ncbi:MAG: short-chain dehydrogenase [Desulfobacterium sp.]|nr:short-chain dehydrogenase [Desulfobacterium sp.]
MKNWMDKTIYITGGSSGIGLSAGRLLAEKGANILIFARGMNQLELAVEKIKSHSASGSQQIACMQLDVSDHQAVHHVMDRAVNEFGCPDLLINSAGRARPGYFHEISYEQMDETMRINFYGVWNPVSALLPHMKQKGGHIVNVSSIAGFLGVFGYTDYSASKFAVIGFSEALKSEVRPYNIQVSVLCPPDTSTPGLEIENRTKPEETREISANAKQMHPDEVAKALLKGIEGRRFMIIPGFDGKLTWILKRMLPGLVEAVMDAKIRKVQNQKL